MIEQKLGVFIRSAFLMLLGEGLFPLDVCLFPLADHLFPFNVVLFLLVNDLFPFTQFIPPKKAASLAAAPSIL